jgi:hypothetical protein
MMCFYDKKSTRKFAGKKTLITFAPALEAKFIQDLGVGFL